MAGLSKKQISQISQQCREDFHQTRKNHSLSVVASLASSPLRTVAEMEAYREAANALHDTMQEGETVYMHSGQCIQRKGAILRIVNS